MTTPPVCNYEGSDYQAAFWEEGSRVYEDRCEAIAIKRLLPKEGHLLLELGAGAGRNTPRYHGFERIVLLDYSTTQLRQAQERLGCSDRYTYVAADIYRLPFVESLFDAATMIRALHHMVDAQLALEQVRRVLKPGAVFILEFANKRNLKAILRYLLRLQKWNPFSPNAVEFEKLNFDFHPRTVFGWLEKLGLKIDRVNTVSHFRVGILKKTIPANVLAAMDGILQPTGALAQLTPSVFLRAHVRKGASLQTPAQDVWQFFQCPQCGNHPLAKKGSTLACPTCNQRYAIKDGIYDFRLTA